MYQFQKLEIWQESVDIVKEVYKITNDFPKEEKYSLASQLQRAAVSISLNIAEGRGCGTNKEFVRFLYISIRSTHEVIAAILIAIELGYISNQKAGAILDMLDRVSARTKALINKLSEKPATNNEEQITHN